MFHRYHWIDSHNPHAAQLFAAKMAPFIKKYKRSLQAAVPGSSSRPLIFLCIGTPLVYGDALGPLVGTMLSTYDSSASNSALSTSHTHSPSNLQHCFYVYGTLKLPVHAENLTTVLHHIQKNFRRPLIIVIDAAIGSPGQQGFLAIKKGALRPGKGLGKHLPPVGHIQITGIFQSLQEYSALDLVKTYGCIITDGLSYFLKNRIFP